MRFLVAECYQKCMLNKYVNIKLAVWLSGNEFVLIA